ncbi:hypothetical protein ACWA2C_28245 [Priestia megaterium]
MKKYDIAVFLDQKNEDGEQEFFEYVETFSGTLRINEIAQIFERKKFITYPHVKGSGITLINMDHVAKISIMEHVAEEEA